jgi:hypothetical protein
LPGGAPPSPFAVLEISPKDHDRDVDPQSEEEHVPKQAPAGRRQKVDQYFDGAMRVR